MNRNQRIALLAMISGMAFVLHSLFFEWSTDSQSWSHVFSSLLCDEHERNCLRIWYDIHTFQHSMLSILLGIVLPLLMLCGACYLWLGIEPSDPKNSITAQLAKEESDKSQL